MMFEQVFLGVNIPDVCQGVLGTRRGVDCVEREFHRQDEPDELGCELIHVFGFEPNIASRLDPDRRTGADIEPDRADHIRFPAFEPL